MNASSPLCDGDINLNASEMLMLLVEVFKSDLLFESHFRNTDIIIVD